MTGFDLVRENKAQYAEMLKRIETMPDGLEKAVASTMMLAWIKGTNWMGGLSGQVEVRACRQLKKMGYDPDSDKVWDEFHRQVDAWDEEHGF